MYNLLKVIGKTSSLVSASFYRCNLRFYEQEHLRHFCQNLKCYQKNGFAVREVLPFYQQERTPSLQDSYVFFEGPMNDWGMSLMDSKTLSSQFANSLESAGIENLLLLMGQRLTPASIRDQRAIPPLKNTLIESASRLYNENLTVGAREWTKHTNRPNDLFWGKIEGNNDDKNIMALEYIGYILLYSTWWNVFYHFKHQIVFEKRLPSGHGARWCNEGTKFIGFLEPFI